MNRYIVDTDSSNVYSILVFDDGSWGVRDYHGKLIAGADAMWLMPKKYLDDIKKAEWVIQK
jgi:hypothetical protein